MDLIDLWKEFRANRRQFFRLVKLSLFGSSLSWFVIAAVLIVVCVDRHGRGLLIAGLILGIYGGYPQTQGEQEAIAKAEISGRYRGEMVPLRMATYLISGLILTVIGTLITT